MTINQALSQGISRLRKPYWNSTAYLELPPKVQDGFGPWCQLHDCGTITDITIFDVDDKLQDWLPLV